METNKFAQMLIQVNQMDHRQRNALLTALSHLSDETQVVEIIESRFDADGVCPFCGHNRYCRYGFANKLQRYRCRECKKTFNALTGTPFTRLRHKNKWLNYFKVLADSLTIRKAATVVGLHRTTSFRWRHRFLTWVQLDHPTVLQGITEADETYLLESGKGSRKLDRKPRKRGGSATKRGLSKEQVCILIARDRSGHTLDFVTGKGPVSKTQLETHLKFVLDHEALLVSDGNRAYKAFCHTEGISHEAVNLSKGRRVIKGAYHIQNVNAYHSRLKSWLSHFHGVATKYLPSYLGWRRSIEQHPNFSAESLLNVALGQFPHLTRT
ncbi:MAG: IS1595 family transposase [Anaerolineaceae bacterium]|nr:IS1595 family transposase [Anaerolineaceae bacterium]